MTDELRDVPREQWCAAAQQAVADGFAFFDVLTGVDHEEAGLEVVLRLWHPQGRRGLQLRTRCPRDDATVPSVVPVLPGAAWHERATAELLGIAFSGHETAPLLLPPSFEGHPLRKDFVLAARARDWPGVKEPGESAADLRPGAGERPRRRVSPPGAPPPGWTQEDR